MACPRRGHAIACPYNFMLQLTKDHLDRIVAQGLEGKPLEICGLLAGHVSGEDTVVVEVYPAESDDKSELTYTVNARDYMRAERAARIRMPFEHLADLQAR